MSPRDRLELHDQIVRLVNGEGEGMSVTAAARELGISVSHAYAVYNDPHGEKERERRERYRGTCEVCGAKTDGSRGPGKAPTRCHKHAPRKQATFTREACIEAVHEWHIIYGRPPFVTEWASSAETPDWVPCSTTVYRVFGYTGVRGESGWNIMIREAGFEPRAAVPPDYAQQSRSYEGSGWDRLTPEQQEEVRRKAKEKYDNDPDHPLRRGQEAARRRAQGWMRKQAAARARREAERRH